MLCAMRSSLEKWLSTKEAAFSARLRGSTERFVLLNLASCQLGARSLHCVILSYPRNLQPHLARALCTTSRRAGSVAPGAWIRTSTVRVLLELEMSWCHSALGGNQAQKDLRACKNHRLDYLDALEASLWCYGRVGPCNVHVIESANARLDILDALLGVQCACELVHSHHMHQKLVLSLDMFLPLLVLTLTCFTHSWWLRSWGREKCF